MRCRDAQKSALGFGGGGHRFRQRALLQHLRQVKSGDPGISTVSVMHQLVYLSSARMLFSREGLLVLLDKARHNNLRDGITGLLLYKGGDFLQVIEGEEADVRRTFARIATDARHGGIEVLVDEPVAQRSFADWSMGFRDLSEAEVQTLPAFSGLMNDPHLPLRLAADSTVCRTLIDFFRHAR